MENLKEKIIREFKAIKESGIFENPTTKRLLIMCLALFALGITISFQEVVISNSIKNDVKNENHIDTEHINKGYSELIAANSKEKQKSTSKDTYEGYLQQGKVISMNFEYSFGESEHFKIHSVYDDSQRTYICLNYQYLPDHRLPILPSIYIKETGKNEFMPVNYRIFNDLETFQTIYLIDKLAKEIELRYSDSEAIKIEHKQ